MSSQQSSPEWPIGASGPTPDLSGKAGDGDRTHGHPLDAFCFEGRAGLQGGGCPRHGLSPGAFGQEPISRICYCEVRRHPSTYAEKACIHIPSIANLHERIGRLPTGMADTARAQSDSARARCPYPHDGHLARTWVCNRSASRTDPGHIAKASEAVSRSRKNNLRPPWNSCMHPLPCG